MDFLRRLFGGAKPQPKPPTPAQREQQAFTKYTQDYRQGKINRVRYEDLMTALGRNGGQTIQRPVNTSPLAATGQGVKTVGRMAKDGFVEPIRQVSNGLTVRLGATNNLQKQIDIGITQQQKHYENIIRQFRAGKIDANRANALIKSIQRPDLMQSNQQMMQMSDPKRFVGGVAETGLNLAGLKVAGFAGKEFFKQAGKQGIKQATKNQLPKVALNTAINTTQGGINAASMGGDKGDIAKAAALSGVIGTGADLALGTIAGGITNPRGASKTVQRVVEDAEVTGLRDRNMLLQRTYDKATNPRIRKQISQQITENNAEIRAIKKSKNIGGYSGGKTRKEMVEEFKAQELGKPAPSKVASQTSKLTSKDGLNVSSKNSVAPELEARAKRAREIEAENTFLESNAGKTIDVDGSPLTIPKGYKAYRRTVTGDTVDVKRLKSDTEYFREAYESTFTKGHGTDEKLYRTLTKELVPKDREASGYLADLYSKAKATQPTKGAIDLRQKKQPTLQTQAGQKSPLGTESPAKQISENILPVDPKGSYITNSTPVKGLLQAPQTINLSPAQAKLRFKSLNKQNRPFAVSNPQNKGSVFTVSPKGVVREGADANRIKVKFLGSKDGTPVKVRPFTAEDYAFETWKDRSAIGLGRETLERNLDLVAGKDAPKIKKFLVDASRDNETSRANFLNNKRTEAKSYIVDQLGIKPKSKESTLVQKYGEGLIDEGDVLKQLDGNEIKAAKVLQATAYFRKQYDELLDQWNVVRKKHGYDPVPKRQDYFRHFQEIQDGINVVGIIKNTRDLPTSISGITDIFNPSKPFSNAELRRTGNKTAYDAVGGFDNYLDSVSRQIYHTDTVQRGRLIEDSIRKLADENPEIELPNFVANLNEWVNVVSGKKSKIDRAAEAMLGRKVYAVADTIRQRTGSNMVGANLSSAMSNFIPFTQSISTTSKPSVVRGLMDTAYTPFKGKLTNIDGVDSSFLTRRFQKGSIFNRGFKRAAEVASTPFKLVDQFTSRSIVAGKYYEGIANGLEKKAAMKAADDYASKVIADRSVGQTPNLFNVKTTGFLTQFQTEVNNQVSFLMRDIPQFAGGNKAKIASALTQFVVFSYLFNEGYEQVMGRRPQLDPINAGLQLAGSGENADKDMKERAKGAYEDIATGLPFTSLFTGGRLPVNAMAPDLGSLAKGVSNISEDPNQAARQIYKGISGPLFYGAPPFGGGQAKKTIEALNTFSKGYSETPTGQVRFAPNKSPGNVAQGVLFGQYATKEGKEYIKNGIKPYGEKASEEFKKTKDKTALEASGKGGAKTKDQEEKLRDLPPEKRKDYEQALKDGRVNEYGEVKRAKDDFAGKAQDKKIKTLMGIPTTVSKESENILVRYGRLSNEGKKKFNADPEKKQDLAEAKLERDLKSGKLTQEEYDKKLGKVTGKKTPKAKKTAKVRVKKGRARKAAKTKVAKVRLGRLPSAKIKLAKAPTVKGIKSKAKSKTKLAFKKPKKIKIA